MTEEILPCPFCGASASIEEVAGPLSCVSFSVGCDSGSEADCMGYQSFTIFSTRGAAIRAWNKRAPLKSATEHIQCDPEKAAEGKCPCGGA